MQTDDATLKSTAPKLAEGPVDAARSYLWAFRLLVLLQAAAILVQAMTAGQFLSGSAGLDLHGTMATAVHATGLLQVVAAILLWRPARGPGWPALASLLMLLAGFVQSALGGSGLVAVHVPLGLVLFGLGIALLVWAFQRRTP